MKGKKYLRSYDQYQVISDNLICKEHGEKFACFFSESDNLNFDFQILTVVQYIKNGKSCI